MIGSVLHDLVVVFVALILESVEELVEHVRREEALDARRILREHRDGLPELGVGHGRRHALERESAGGLGLGTQPVAIEDDSTVLERRDDTHVDTSIGRGPDRVDPREGVVTFGFPRTVRDIPRSLAFEYDATNPPGLDHVHEDIGRSVGGHDERDHVALELGIEAQTLHRGDLVLAPDPLLDHDVREGVGDGMHTGGVEGVEGAVATLTHPRAVEHLADANVVHADDAVLDEGLRNAQRVLDLHRHVATCLDLRHLRADHEDRLLQGQLEEHREVGAGLGKRVRAVQDDEGVVRLVRGLDHLTHDQTIRVPHVGGILLLIHVLEVQLDSLGHLDAFEELFSGCRRHKRLADHAERPARVDHVEFHRFSHRSISLYWLRNRSKIEYAGTLPTRFL